MNQALSWGNCVSNEFRSKLLEVCKKLWLVSTREEVVQRASWLLGCMAFETGESFSPKVRNAAGSGAVGLIQFMPKTAQWLGTSTDELAAMTAVQQLEYVGRYFKPYAPAVASLSDMYMAILLPKYVGKPDHSVLFSGGVAYRQNAGLDKDQDGVVTKAEASLLVETKFRKGLRPQYVYVLSGA